MPVSQGGWPAAGAAPHSEARAKTSPGRRATIRAFHELGTLHRLESPRGRCDLATARCSPPDAPNVTAAGGSGRFFSGGSAGLRPPLGPPNARLASSIATAAFSVMERIVCRS